MSDSEASHDIETEESRSSDGSDSGASLQDFIASEDEGDSPATDYDSADDIEPNLIIAGKRKRIERTSHSPLIDTDPDDSDYVEWAPYIRRNWSRLTVWKQDKEQ